MVRTFATNPTMATIAGGFVRVPVDQIVDAWHACRASPLGIADFRAWLACHEMKARREPVDRAPHYTPAELARLLGVSQKRAKNSIRKLVAAELLEWSESDITFPEPPLPSLHNLEDTIGRGRGVLVVPRRILRLLVGGARPALIATVLAILLRCLSRRRHGFDGRGRVKASWIATTFGIDHRRVKAARIDLIALGWITPEPDGQTAMNRWGRAYRINLVWERTAGPDGRSLPPPTPAGGRTLPPPLSDQDPLPEEIRNQEPLRSEVPGIKLPGRGDESQPPPTLNDIRPEDLRETGRTLALFEQAVARKRIGPSESDRLKFIAVAEHARVVGTVNPCGLFARLVRRGWWHFATQDDEDAAARRLRTHLHGRPLAVEAPRARVSTFVPEGGASAPMSLGSLLGRLMKGPS